MGRDDDRPSWVEREKKSFSELDRMRRERRPEAERRPRSRAAQERAARATRQYVKQIDGLFSSSEPERLEKLAQAMRDARGTPALADACRAYRDALGPPADPRHISCFLDAGEREIVVDGLEALRRGHEAGELELTAGLRSQLRMLAEDPDDEVAERAEALLELLQPE
jgi:hypothetical protein